MMRFNTHVAGVVHVSRRQQPAAGHAVTPRRARRSRAKARVVSRPASGQSAFPTALPRPSPQVTSEALPYCILRRMSTDDHGTGPSGCGAV